MSTQTSNPRDRYKRSDKHLPYPLEEHQGRLIMGDPVAEAYEWILRYAENLTQQVSEYDTNEWGDDDAELVPTEDPITVDELIDVALDTKNGGWSSISRGGTFEGVSVDPMFWDKLAILKQIEIPSHQRENFFSCSC